jgi:integrase/recombinase XerD
MTSIDTAATTIQLPDPDFALDAAHLAAAAFLARYSGRTLDADRHDLRGYFNWTASVGLAVLDATRPHIELYRSWLEERGLAASTVDRRLSTVCGFYRFAHIDGRCVNDKGRYGPDGTTARTQSSSQWPAPFGFSSVSSSLWRAT